MLKHLKDLIIFLLLFISLGIFYIIKGHSYFSIFESIPINFYNYYLTKNYNIQVDSIKEEWNGFSLQIELQNAKYKSKDVNINIKKSLFIFNKSLFPEILFDQVNIIINKSSKLKLENKNNFTISSNNLKLLSDLSFLATDISISKDNKELYINNISKLKNNIVINNALNKIYINFKEENKQYNITGNFNLETIFVSKFLDNFNFKTILKDIGYHEYYQGDKNLYGHFKYEIKNNKEDFYLEINLNKNNIELPFLNNIVLKEMEGTIIYHNNKISTKNIRFKNDDSYSLGRIDTKDNVLSVALYLKNNQKLIKDIFNDRFLNNLISVNKPIEVIINSHFNDYNLTNINIKTTPENINFKFLGVEDKFEQDINIKYLPKSKKIYLKSEEINAHIDLVNNYIDLNLNESESKENIKDKNINVSGNIHTLNYNNFIKAINLLSGENKGDKIFNIDLTVYNFIYNNNVYKNVELKSDSDYKGINIFVKDEFNDFKIYIKNNLKDIYIQGNKFKYITTDKNFSEHGFSSLFIDQNIDIDLKKIIINEYEIDNIITKYNSNKNSIKLINTIFNYKELYFNFNLEILKQNSMYKVNIYSKDKIIKTKNIKDSVRSNNVSTKNLALNGFINFKINENLNIKKDSIQGLLHFNAEDLYINNEENKNNIELLRFLNIFNLENILKIFSFNLENKEGILFKNSWGSLNIDKGVIKIQDNLYFKGDLANFRIKGSINLNNEKINLKGKAITPALKSASGIALFAASPQVAGAIWLFDKITGEKLNEIVSKDFKIKGNISNPEFE